MEEIAQGDTHKSLRFWYDRAVDEQKKEFREYKKKLKAQEAMFKSGSLTAEIEEKDLTQGQAIIPHRSITFMTWKKEKDEFEWAAELRHMV